MSSTSDPGGPSRPARRGIFTRIRLRSRSRSRGHRDMPLTDATGSSSLLECPDPIDSGDGDAAADPGGGITTPALGVTEASGASGTTPEDNCATTGDSVSIPQIMISEENSDSATTTTDQVIIVGNSGCAIPAIQITDVENTGEADSSGGDVATSCNENKTVEITGTDSASIETSGNTTRSDCWEQGLAKLTDKQRQVLHDFGINNTNTIDVEIKTIQSLKDGCTKNLCPGHRNKKPILTRARIHGILKKIEKYVVIGDIAIQHNPDIVALVWAGLRFCLQVALNDMQTFEAISSALDDIADIMGSCKIYEKIHRFSQLESAKAVIFHIPKLYASCLRFMADAIDYFNTDALKRVAVGITNPFVTCFKPLIDDIATSKGELERRAAVASHELQNEMNEYQKEEFGRLNNQLSRVSSGVEGLLARVDENKRRDVLRWLSKVDYGAHHEKARDLRFNDTGGWLFGKREFEDWVESQCSSVLWVCGTAGSGKTILSSLVIDTLTETYKSIPTIYFYCNYGESDRQQAGSVTGSLLKQLSTRHTNMDPEMMTLYNNDQPLNIKSAEALLAAALSRFASLFIVVDALDECSETERKYLVMLLTRLLTLDGCKCQIKIFLTSRPEEDLRRLLGDHSSYQIDANDTAKDIRPFVAAALSVLITSGTLLNGNVTSELRIELVETISSQADGMFLWATFQLDHIRKQGNEAEVRNQLSKLPAGLNQTYDRIWARVTGEFSDDTEKKWALRTLQWVLLAKRPLSPEEILEATALEPLDTTPQITDSPFKPERMASSLEYLIRVCGNFVALDERTRRLRFVHYSVQEYLSKKQEFESSERTVAEHCMTALGIGRVGDSSKFYDYAAHYWQMHARCWDEIDSRLGNLIQRFLLNNQCFLNWREIVSRHSRYDSYLGTPHLSLGTPHLSLAYFNLPVILQYLHQQGSTYWQTDALCISAGLGYSKVVEICLASGADVHATGPSGRSSLQCASYGGFANVVDILLTAGANINYRNLRTGKSALHLAAIAGHEKMVEHLLAAGASLNLRDSDGRSALQYASCRSDQATVRPLLAAGATIDICCREGKSALHYAGERGDSVTVEMLLAAGANIDICCPEGRNALIYASKRGRHAGRQGDPAAVGVLLAAGANIDICCREGKSALHYASERGDSATVEMLLAAGANIDICCLEGKSALIYASSRDSQPLHSGDETVVKLLLAANANPNVYDKSRLSALGYAAGRGFEKIVRILLAAGASVRVPDSTMRSYSLGNEKVKRDVLELLLACSVDPRVINGTVNPSPLCMAARYGRDSIVELLLAAGADVSETSRYSAAFRGNILIFGLLATGIDCKARGELGSTALQYAVRGDSMRMIERELAAGADVNYRDSMGRSALHDAAEWGRGGAVQLLLAAGACVYYQGRSNGYNWNGGARTVLSNITDLQLSIPAEHEVMGMSHAIFNHFFEGLPYYGQYQKLGTPLHIAAYRGNCTVLELLLSAGADPNGCNLEGGSVLQDAVNGGHHDITQLLLTAGADINVQGGYYGSPLHIAVQDISPKVMKQMLAAGADVNAQGGYYRSVLDREAGQGQKAIVQLMMVAADGTNALGSKGISALKRSASTACVTIGKYLHASSTDPKAQGQYYGTPLHAAACFSRPWALKPLLAAGAEVNCRNSDGGSPLQDAASKGVEENVKILLAAGADANIRDFHGVSAVHSAANYGFLEIVKLLIAAGADVNAQGWYFGSGIEDQVVSSREMVEERLFAAGAEPNAQERYFKSDEHDTVSMGLVKLLLAAGADAHICHPDGGSPLHIAVDQGFITLLQIPLDVATHVHPETETCASPLYVAALGGHHEIVELLLAAGADVNACNSKGTSVLHEAASRNNVEIIKILLAAGADTNLVDSSGKSAMQKARENGCNEVVQLLLASGYDGSEDVPTLDVVANKDSGAIAEFVGADADAVVEESPSFEDIITPYEPGTEFQDLEHLPIQNSPDLLRWFGGFSARIFTLLSLISLCWFLYVVYF